MKSAVRTITFIVVVAFQVISLAASGTKDDDINTLPDGSEQQEGQSLSDPSLSVTELTKDSIGGLVQFLTPRFESSNAGRRMASSPINPKTGVSTGMSKRKGLLAPIAKFFAAKRRKRVKVSRRRHRPKASRRSSFFTRFQSTMRYLATAMKRMLRRRSGGTQRQLFFPSPFAKRIFGNTVTKTRTFFQNLFSRKPQVGEADIPQVFEMTTTRAGVDVASVVDPHFFVGFGLGRRKRSAMEKDDRIRSSSGSEDCSG